MRRKLKISIALLVVFFTSNSCSNLLPYNEIGDIKISDEKKYVYTLETPAMEAAILTSMSYDVPLSDIDESFYLNKYANIQILGKKAILYQINFKGERVGFITDDFLNKNDFYYNSSPVLDTTTSLFRSTATTKGWVIDCQGGADYVIISYFNDSDAI